MSYTEMNFASGGGASSAEKVSYNNAISGLSADNVQGAIDEVANKKIKTLDCQITLMNSCQSNGAYLYEIAKGFYYLFINIGCPSALSSKTQVGTITSSDLPKLANFNRYKAFPTESAGTCLFFVELGNLYLRSYPGSTKWVTAEFFFADSDLEA